MTDGEDLIVDAVVSSAERIEEFDPDDLDDDEMFEDYLGALDYYVKCSLGGAVREVTAVTGTGGPHIEVNLTKGYVEGWWGGDTHTAHVFENEDRLNDLGDRIARRFEETVVA